MYKTDKLRAINIFAKNLSRVYNNLSQNRERTILIAQRYIRQSAKPFLQRFGVLIDTESVLKRVSIATDVALRRKGNKSNYLSHAIEAAFLYTYYANNRLDAIENIWTIGKQFKYSDEFLGYIIISAITRWKHNYDHLKLPFYFNDPLQLAFRGIMKATNNEQQTISTIIKGYYLRDIELTKFHTNDEKNERIKSSIRELFGIYDLTENKTELLSCICRTFLPELYYSAYENNNTIIESETYKKVYSILNEIYFQIYLREKGTEIEKHLSTMTRLIRLICTDMKEYAVRSIFVIIIKRYRKYFETLVTIKNKQNLLKITLRTLNDQINELIENGEISIPKQIIIHNAIKKLQ